MKRYFKEELRYFHEILRYFNVKLRYFNVKLRYFGENVRYFGENVRYFGEKVRYLEEEVRYIFIKSWRKLSDHSIPALDSLISFILSLILGGVSGMVSLIGVRTYSSSWKTTNMCIYRNGSENWVIGINSLHYDRTYDKDMFTWLCWQ